MSRENYSEYCFCFSNSMTPSRSVYFAEDIGLAAIVYFECDVKGLANPDNFCIDLCLNRI